MRDVTILGNLLY